MKFKGKPVTARAILLAACIIIAGGILLLFGTLEITSQPIFCSSCHYMKPYYKQWKASSHNKVNCLDCHSKPGFTNYLKRKFAALHEVASMVTGKYPPRPHAEVDDASCLRQGCHETRLLKGKVSFKGISFDHTPHLTQERRGRKLRCTTCHAQMAMGRHIAVTEEVCFLCHFKDRMQTPEASTSAFCLKCHKVPDTAVTIRNTKETFTHTDYVKGKVQCQDCHTGIIRGDGKVPKVMCFQCHNKPENLEKFDDIPFIHENHITKHKVECYLCHTEIEHSIYPKDHGEQAPSTPASCTRCHGNGHLASQLLYKGIGARNVAGVTSSMYRAHVSCTACHRITPQDTVSFATGTHFPKADQTGCALCHGSDGASYYQDWNGQLKTALSAADAALGHANSNRPQIEKDSAASKKFADAEYNIRFVKAGKGIHNIEYSVAILENATKNLQGLSQGKK